ncbi:unnamed protein product, partial [Clonostachys byssicola]
GPGFGKTRALAVASYGLVRSVGRVYMSAPTNIACDNAADRLMDVSTDVTNRLNANLQPGDEPLRRLLVVRGYKREDELAAFMRILQSPEAVTDATPRPHSKHESHWKLGNSIAFWLLKLEQARGFAIDEAACMSRPDFYSVWGNTMMPCVMAGDRLQLDVSVRSFNDAISYSDGVYRNRHGPDARISIMEFLQASGWPIFRLHTQLRMARGLFTLSQEVIYPELRAQYGVRCDISLPGHASGRAMEAFMLRKFPNVLRPSPKGTLREVFVHCPDSRVIVNPMTKSKSSPGQVRIALRLLDELVRDTQARGTRINPSEIAIIVLHSANVEVVEHQLKLYASLVGKVVVSTVESIQGKERPIALVILGTNETTGPGLSKEPRRFNVAISRHTSFLLLVGDINVAGNFRSGSSTTNARGRGGGQGGRGGRA